MFEERLFEDVNVSKLRIRNPLVGDILADAGERAASASSFVRKRCSQIRSPAVFGFGFVVEAEASKNACSSEIEKSSERAKKQQSENYSSWGWHGHRMGVGFGLFSKTKLGGATTKDATPTG